MNVVTNKNNSFLITGETGDIISPSEQGFYDSDTRFLSDYRFFISDKELKKLTGRPVSYYSAVHYLTNPTLDGIKEGTIAVARNQLVGDGFHEDITVTNYNRKPVRLTLKMVSKTDFADIFEVKAHKFKRRLKVESIYDKENNMKRLVYEDAGLYRETRIKITKVPTRILKNGFVWQIILEPKESWHLCCNILPLTSPKENIDTVYKCSQFGLIKVNGVEHFEEYSMQVASIDTDYVILKQSYEQSIDDLAALRLAGIKESDVPAAGIPWFMTYFGRDSLITALQTLLVAPKIAKGVLLTLAKFQGKKVDALSEEEPGKILHEVRFGRLARGKNVSYSIYYGTIDATLLYIILLYEYYMYSADKKFLTQKKETLKKALAWINKYGDRDGDGYLEYERRNKDGLFNQAWKDSFDGVAFFNGAIPKLPIATCEVQGYAYDAKLKGSYLLNKIGEERLALKYKEEAKELKKRFNKDFWMEENNFFAQALDKEKKQVNSISSNPGHLLWSKIVDKDKAKMISKRMLSDEFFSGWGIRTLSLNNAQYNPISYHNGSIWPHDNSIIAKGMLNYGFIEQAHRVIMGIIEASSYFSYMRLPELFCGFDRKSTLVPIEYPTSNSPQAWAAGSIPFMLTSLLNIEADAEKKSVEISPKLLPKMNKLIINKLKIFDKEVNLSIYKEGKEVRTQITNNTNLKIVAK